MMSSKYWGILLILTAVLSACEPPPNPAAQPTPPLPPIAVAASKNKVAPEFDKIKGVTVEKLLMLDAFQRASIISTVDSDGYDRWQSNYELHGCEFEIIAIGDAPDRIKDITLSIKFSKRKELPLVVERMLTSMMYLQYENADVNEGLAWMEKSMQLKNPRGQDEWHERLLGRTCWILTATQKSRLLHIYGAEEPWPPE